MIWCPADYIYDDESHNEYHKPLCTSICWTSWICSRHTSPLLPRLEFKKKLYLKLLVRSEDFQITYPIFEYEKTIQVKGKTNVHPKRCMLYWSKKLNTYRPICITVRSCFVMPQRHRQPVMTLDPLIYASEPHFAASSWALFTTY